MDKKTLYHIISWVVALAACGYLVYRLATYDGYAALAAGLRQMTVAQWLALALCVALMPVNMAIEAWKWRTLIMHNAEGTEHNFSFAEAQRQVYYSKLAGLITPWRLGEYPARGLLMARHDAQCTNSKREIWAQVLSLGAVGSATMTAVIIITGIVAMMMTDLRFEISDFRFSYLPVVAVFLALLGVALYFAPRLLKRWAAVSHRLVAITLGQSFVRLVCWCVQLALVLWALGAVTSGGLPVLGYGIPVYYLLVTVTPNVPIAEAGVRGVWAIAVFGSMNAALAGVLLWGVNTLLPCLVWPFIRKNNKNTCECTHR